ncbi:hypothetical protein SBA3_330016 [Candidatus Sulfopaludibacter sp. SbA3]|nr:hypothetical protein SBA3_330016 [Candidatus Sulfopaludibacter sp. SbA3]
MAFLGWKHPGPIEAGCQPDGLRRAFHFWDGNIPAPLKLEGSSLEDLQKMDFWDGNIPAPLKLDAG